MRIVVVGRKGGKRRVRWASAIGLGVTLALVVGLGCGVVFYLLAQRWSHFPVLFGLVVGVAMAMLGVIHGLRAPIEDLAELP
ncbi:MAG: hypothetical protein V2A58_13040 [Planctomycetota bacterium]